MNMEPDVSNNMFSFWGPESKNPWYSHGFRGFPIATCLIPIGTGRHVSPARRDFTRRGPHGGPSGGADLRHDASDALQRHPAAARVSQRAGGRGSENAVKTPLRGVELFNIVYNNILLYIYLSIYLSVYMILYIYIYLYTYICMYIWNMYGIYNPYIIYGWFT